MQIVNHTFQTLGQAESPGTTGRRTGDDAPTTVHTHLVWKSRQLLALGLL